MFVLRGLTESEGALNRASCIGHPVEFFREEPEGALSECWTLYVRQFVCCFAFSFIMNFLLNTCGYVVNRGATTTSVVRQNVQGRGGVPAQPYIGAVTFDLMAFGSHELLT